MSPPNRAPGDRTAGQRAGSAAQAAADAGAPEAPPLWQALWIAAVAGVHLRTGTPLERGLAEAGAAVAVRMPPGEPLHPRAAAAAKDVAYAAARQRALADAIVARLVARSPTPPAAALLGAALAQLFAQRHAAYAVVDQAVRAAHADAATAAAAGFVNAVLRNALREGEALVADCERDPAVRCNLPAWWLQRLQQDHPRQWQSIVRVQRLPPPLVLRVNPLRTTRAAYLERLAQAGLDAVAVGADGVWLRPPRPIEAIAGFADGEVTVQDAGAQLAAPFLGVADGMRVLDACGAPGGKTAHLAALAAIDLTAVDRDRDRIARIDNNLARLGRHPGARVSVLVGDVVQLASTGKLPYSRYDRILLDAPCTASGIVRRHPDIPWLRRSGDVAQLATQQRLLLDALWPLLGPAGRLLYAVCSLFSEEGERQVQRFLARTPNARALPLPGCDPGASPSLQLLPAEAEAECADGLPPVHDGFFYALLEKQD